MHLQEYSQTSTLCMHALTGRPAKVPYGPEPPPPPPPIEQQGLFNMKPDAMRKLEGEALLYYDVIKMFVTSNMSRTYVMIQHGA